MATTAKAKTPAPAKQPAETPPTEESNVESPASNAELPDNPPEQENEPPVEETPPEQPTNIIDDPFMASLKADAKELLTKKEEEPEIQPVDDELPAEVPPKGQVVPAGTAETTGGTPALPAPEKKTRKKMEIVVPPIESTPHPALSPVEAERVPKVETPAADPDAEYVKALNEEQRAELEEAEHAEKHFGERYKGRRKQLLDFFKSVDKFATEHPAAALEDEEFQKVLKGKPSLAPTDQRRVIREMAEAQATKKVRESVDPELADIKRRQRLVESEPQVQSVTDQFGAGLHDFVCEEEGLKPIAEVIATKGLAEAEKEFKFKAKIVHEENVAAKAAAREYTLLSGFVGGQPLKPFDPQNETHKWVNGFIGAQCDYFKANGGAKLKDGSGRMFMTRTEYAQAVASDPDAAKKYWTLGHAQILELIAVNAKMTTMRRIQETEEWAKANGFDAAKPGNSVAAPKTGAEPTPLEATRTRSKPAPGAALPPKPTKQEEAGVNVAEAMGLKL